VSALLLSAVGGLGGKAGVAFTADSLVTVELTGKHGKRGVVHSSAQTQDEMQGRLLLNIVITKSSPILELLSGENKTLLIRRNSLLVLDLGLYVVDRIRRFHVKCDSLSRKSLYEDLHGWVLGDTPVEANTEHRAIEISNER